MSYWDEAKKHLKPAVLEAIENFDANKERERVAAGDNPYLRLFREQKGSGGVYSFYARDALTKRYAWAVPDERAIEIVAKYAPLVEIGAGTGYWAALLKARGVDVVPYDAQPPTAKDHSHYSEPVQYVEVLKGSCEKLDEHQDRNLFLVWPPYDDPFAADCAKRFAGQYVVFVGEGRGGCNGDDAFFKYLNENFEEVEEYDIPQWRGLHDRLRVWRRK